MNKYILYNIEKTMGGFKVKKNSKKKKGKPGGGFKVKIKFSKTCYF
jgi:hypothetical protein